MAGTRLTCRTLTFETVTPVFLGGIDASRRTPGRDDADLRADAILRVRPIVAQWRFWFRALLGGVWGTSDLREIAAEEAAVFGGVATAREAAAGFHCRLHRESEILDVAQYRGLAYGMDARRAQGQLVELARWAIKPGQRFTLELLCAADVWEILRHVIGVWSLLGGLGARYRRGVGSVRWVDARPPEVGLQVPIRPTQISQVVTAARKALGQRFGNRSWSGTPSFDVVHPHWCALKLSNSFPSWEQALEAIRNQLRLPPQFSRNHRPPAPTLAAHPSPPTTRLGPGFGWRQRPSGSGNWPSKSRGSSSFYLGRDHSVVNDLKNRAAGGRPDPPTPPTLLNPVFGLPVPYPTWNTTVDLVKQGEATRRPSPLTFRVLKQEHNSYVVLVALFKRDVIPPGAEVSVRVQVGGGRRFTVRVPPNMQDLEDFVAKCDGIDVRFS